jgi:hypothetical protein
MMVSPHNFNLIEAARILVNKLNLIIIGIEPETVDYQLGLSATLSKAFIQIVEDVKDYIVIFEYMD